MFLGRKKKSAPPPPPPVLKPDSKHQEPSPVVASQPCIVAQTGKFARSPKICSSDDDKWNHFIAKLNNIVSAKAQEFL